MTLSLVETFPTVFTFRHVIKTSPLSVTDQMRGDPFIREITHIIAPNAATARTQSSGVFTSSVLTGLWVPDFEAHYATSSPFSAHLLLHAGPCLGVADTSTVWARWKLIERDGCSSLIQTDSTTSPEVIVPPHAGSFHRERKVCGGGEERRLFCEFSGCLPKQPDDFIRKSRETVCSFSTQCKHKELKSSEQNPFEGLTLVSSESKIKVVCGRCKIRGTQSWSFGKPSLSGLM